MKPMVKDEIGKDYQDQNLERLSLVSMKRTEGKPTELQTYDTLDDKLGSFMDDYYTCNGFNSNSRTMRDQNLKDGYFSNLEEFVDDKLMALAKSIQKKKDLQKERNDNRAKLSAIYEDIQDIASKCNEKAKKLDKVLEITIGLEQNNEGLKYAI
jgi:hypothetical protein